MGGGRWPNSQIGFSAGWPLTTETSTPDLINPACDNTPSTVRVRPVLQVSYIGFDHLCPFERRPPVLLSRWKVKHCLSTNPIQLRHRLAEGLLSTTVRRYQRKHMGF